MLNKLKQMIKQAVLNLIDDTGPFPRGQADYNGKTTDFLHYIPYGLISNPPPKSWVLLLSLQAQESSKVGLVADFINRKKDGLPGEAGLFNSLTGSFVLLKATGEIEVEAKAGLIANVTGNTSLTSTGGSVVITATTSITLQTTGNVDILNAGTVNLGGSSGAGVARIGDSVAGGVITSGSSRVKAVA